MASPHDCVHEDDFRRLESLVTRVFDKMDTFLDEIHTVMVADASRQEKILQNEKDIDRAFRDIREVTKTVASLVKWQQEFSGAIKVMFAIPVICTIITTIIAVYKLMGPA